MSQQDETLYSRLGGYDAVVIFVDKLLPRLQADDELGRFWQHRGDDGVARERQLLIDFLVHVMGGPMYYTGRDMKLSHAGMGITDADWLAFLTHAGDTLAELNIAEKEQKEIVDFVLTLKDDIVD